MQNLTLAIGVTLTTCLFPTVSTAAIFSDLYVFGDSLADDGNFFERSQTVTPVPPSPFPGPPYPGPPYFEGRFSNGPVWVELLPEKLGFDYNSDNNFAYGGAGTGGFHRGGEGFPGTLEQIDEYLQGNAAADPSALYVVSAGANDYLETDTPEELIQDTQSAIQNSATAVDRLYAAGARNFLVVNLPNLSLTPLASAFPEPSRNFLNLLTDTHNALLTNRLESLRNSFENIEITELDLDFLIEQVFDNPGEFGFTFTAQPCLEQNGLSPTDGCENPNEHLFWDTMHPSAAGHRLIAERAAEQFESVPEPSSVFGLLGGILGTRLLRRASKKTRKE